MVLSAEQQRKKEQAASAKLSLARELARRGGTKTIFVGGRTFRASGGRLISETQFERARAAEAEAKASRLQAEARAAEAEAEASRLQALAKAQKEATAKRQAEARARKATEDAARKRLLAKRLSSRIIIRGQVIAAQQRKISVAKKKVFPQGKQSFIAAVDVGQGRMQDFRFDSQGGKLIVSKPIGVSGPQSTRFKESGRIGKSAREVALSRVGVLPDLKKELTPTQRKIIKFQTALRKIGDKFAKLVPAEGGIEGLFSKKKPPSQIVIERVPSEPSAQATPIITARGKTFFETLGINPNSQNSKNLKKRVERTQSLFAGSVLNQTQAKERNDKALKDFQSKEIVKGIPTAVALGAGFALLQAVPVVGQVAGVLLGAELVLRRKEIVKQFKEFPLETAGTFAAFAAGGFAGGKVLNKVSNLAALEASGLTFVIEKKVGVRKTPLSKTFPKEIKFKINEKAVKTFAVDVLKKSGVDFGKLSKGNQNFVTGQIKAFIRNNPAKLIPKIRQVALKNFKASQLNKLVKQRLAGKFDKPIDFRKIRKRKGFERLSRQDRVAILTFSRSLKQRRIIKRRVKERVKFIKERKIKIDKTASINEIIDQAVKLISEKDVVTAKGTKVGGFVKRGKVFLVKQAPKVLKKEIVAHEKGHIIFGRLRVHSRIKKLSSKKQKQLLSISKGTLKRLGVLKSLTSKKAKSVGLTKNQLIIEEFLVRRATPRIKRIIKARGAAAIRIRQAVKKGRRPIKIEEVLTPKQKLEVRNRLLREIRFNPRRFISKTGRLALEKLSKAQERRAIGRAIRKGRKDIKIREILSKTQKEELLRRIKRQAKLQPEKFIPRIRREALKIAKEVEEKQIQSGRQVLIQKQKQVQKQAEKLKEFEVISPKITAIQRLALKRSKQAGKGESKTKLKKAQRTVQRVIEKVEQKQKQVQKQIQKERQKQAQKVKQTIKQIQKVKSKIKQRAKQRLSFAQFSRQKSKLGQKLKQQQKLATAQAQKSKQVSKQVSLFKQSFSQVSQATAQLQKARAELKSKLKLKRVQVKPKFRIKVKKRRITKKKRKPQQGFNVFARPLKKRKGQKRPKLIRVNKTALTKQQAKRLGSTLVDSTLSRTFRIKPTKAKAQKPRLKTKTFQKRKFRTFRIIKGKKVPLPKGKFIEKGGRFTKQNFLLDLKGEKKGITLRRGLKQLRKASRIPKRKPIKRITTKKKRTLSQAQLDALTKGRKKRLSNLKRKK